MSNKSDKSSKSSKSSKSNRERAKWRAQCRQKLAEHIGEKLGYSFEPMDVRLITGPDNPYVWDYPQECDSLFQKQLGNHSTGAYMKLISEVGKTIPAVPVSTNKPAAPAGCASDAVDSGARRAQQPEERCSLLEREHARAIEESIQWQLRATESLQLKSSAEVELAIVRAELRSAQGTVQELHFQLTASSNTLRESALLGACSANGKDEILGRSQKVRPR